LHSPWRLATFDRSIKLSFPSLSAVKLTLVIYTHAHTYDLIRYICLIIIILILILIIIMMICKQLQLQKMKHCLKAMLNSEMQCSSSCVDLAPHIAEFVYRLSDMLLPNEP